MTPVDANNQFGSSVALFGSTLVAGSPGVNPATGTACVIANV